MESITVLSVALLLEAAQAPPAVSSFQEVCMYDQQTLPVLASPDAYATLAQDMAAAVVLDVTVPTHVSLAGLPVPQPLLQRQTQCSMLPPTPKKFRLASTMRCCNPMVLHLKHPVLHPRRRKNSATSHLAACASSGAWSLQEESLQDYAQVGKQI
eukprot:1600881-Amphidinium_carterae.1